jgi:hypothetical protein
MKNPKRSPLDLISRSPIGMANDVSKKIGNIDMILMKL